MSGFGNGPKDPDIAAARERFRYYTPISAGTFRELLPSGTLRVERHLGIPMSFVMTRLAAVPKPIRAEGAGQHLAYG